MEKRIGILNNINCRKKRQILMALILILSLISVSAIVSGSRIDNQGNTGVNLEQKIRVDNADKVLEQKQDKRNIDLTENWGDTEEELQQEDSRVDKIENWEYTGEPEKEHNRNIERVESWEDTEEELQQENSRVDETENRENAKELEQEDNISKDDQQNTQEKLEKKDNSKLDSKGKQGCFEKKREQIENKKTDLTEIQGSTGEKLEQKENINKNNQHNTQEKLEQKDNRKSGSKVNQENTGEKVEQVETRKTDQTGSKGSTGEKEEQNQEAKDKKEGRKSSESNLKLKTKINNVEYSSVGVGAKTKLKTGIYKEPKSLKSLAVKPEIETRALNGTQNLENENVNPEIQPNSINSTKIPEKEAISETKSEGSSWNNLKFIQSYPYSLQPFYTTQESVKISYKGPEAFGKQKVEIYLIKEHNPSFPEKTVSNGMNESTVNLKDVLNENTESYVKIPVTLNAGGDLSPLTLGPLSAGSYWILITLAGDETGKTELEKKVLLANYFEVLKYEMKVYAPDTLKEGENLEVNLSLKNAPAQNGYTYWAVLLREDAYKKDEGISPGRISETRPLVNGVDIIKNLETNLTGYESRAGKDELKNKIQTLIGKGNGTINIGEENQSTLSLKSHELPPGDYLLLAGAYENDEGLAGIAQKELRISAKNSYGLNLESCSGNHTLGNISSMENKIYSFIGFNSTLGTPKTFMSEDIKPYIKAKSIVETVRNPPKAPSFLLGFAGTLLIVLAILRIKK